MVGPFSYVFTHLPYAVKTYDRCLSASFRHVLLYPTNEVRLLTAHLRCASAFMEGSRRCSMRREAKAADSSN